MDVLIDPAMICQCANSLDQVFVLADHGAAVAKRTKVFSRKETETRDSIELRVCPATAPAHAASSITLTMPASD
jgi:hypothetical protein